MPAGLDGSVRTAGLGEVDTQGTERGRVGETSAGEVRDASGLSSCQN